MLLMVRMTRDDFKLSELGGDLVLLLNVGSAPNSMLQ